jgi:hypothetical protein
LCYNLAIFSSGDRYDYFQRQNPNGIVIYDNSRPGLLDFGSHCRIQIDQPNITPLPVSVIVAQIAHSTSFEEILDGYPDLEREEIQQAIEYAASLTQGN